MDIDRSTLCYIKSRGRILLLYRCKKKNDVNEGKWIGVGGHIEVSETPLECVKREIYEETGLKTSSCDYRGIVTFIQNDTYCEEMHLFTATPDLPSGYNYENLPDCDEGILKWVPEDEAEDLPTWEGDKIFIRLIRENKPFFRLRLSYYGDKLVDSSVSYD